MDTGLRISLNQKMRVIRHGFKLDCSNSDSRACLPGRFPDGALLPRSGRHAMRHSQECATLLLDLCAFRALPPEALHAARVWIESAFFPSCHHYTTLLHIVKYQ
jgi:hypothetical protein